ncbi:TonB-dependent receptor domain-containing protein [Ahrensia kielensis]|uniref:TonB-dependent receptor domain-containing protein n=1 Tax=Ahrensia kielensis TaxID=76980 RepID=UPI000364CD66|nr:TonB-dependent receptor [Ahrensia kielensis]
MSKSILFLASTVSIFSLVSYAQAQDAVELNRIVIGTEANDDNSVEVTDEDIVRINPTDLQDLFAAEPTIAVGSSLPVSQKLYVNGVEETNLSVSIDGSRQNNKIFHHNATTLIDPSLLKAVSIDPGVAPADAGPGALAGSIQYETKDVDDLLPDGKMFGGFTIGEYSTNGDVFTTSNALYARKDGFEALGFIKYAKGDWQQDGDGNEILGSGTKLLSGLGKIAYQSEIGHRIELSYERVGDDEARPYRANIGFVAPPPPPRPAPPLTRNYDLTRQNVALTYTNENPVGLWDPTIQLAYSITNLAAIDDNTAGFGQTDSFNGKVENRFGLDNGSITAGVDFFADSANLTYENFSNSALNVDGKEKASNIGIYAQARLDITDRFRTSFGARADFQRIEGVTGFTDNTSGLSANLSGEFDVTDYLTASAGASHVFGGIPLAENFILNPTWDYSSGFKAVTSNNVFAGLNARFGNFNVSGKVFHTAINDARTPNYYGGPALTKDMTSTGFEVGLGYDWGNGFARVGYANIDTKIDGDPSDSYTGNYLTTPIGQIFTLETAHTFADYGVTIGGSGQIVLEETDNFGGSTTETTLAGYEVFNAFVEYTPLNYENLTLRAAVNNIFDETYASRATYGQEFLGEVTPLNEPGRSFKLSLKAKF